MAKRDARRAQMADLVRRFEGSGQSGAAFCGRHRLRPQQLSYWRRVLGRGKKAAKPARRRQPGRAASFTPVRVIGAGVPMVGTGVEVTLPGGERLVVRPGTPKDLVREVVEVLRARC
jgi:hypothetical protein